MMTLDQLQVGQRAQVRQVTGDDEVTLRLLEMGLLDGVQIELVGRAPWGDPLDVRIRGYRMSVRLAEAQRVVLEQADRC